MQVGQEFIFQLSKETRFGCEFDLPYGLIVEVTDIRKDGSIDVERVGDDWAFTHNVQPQDLGERQYTEEEEKADQWAVVEIETENAKHNESSKPY